MLIDRKLNSSSSVASVFLVNILIIYFSFLNFQKIVNASCAFTNGQIGECVKFEECRSAIILAQKGVNPGFCSLEENTVCCIDYRDSPQAERRPLSEAQPSHSRKWASQTFGLGNPSSDVKDTLEDDPNSSKKKHSVGVESSGSIYGKKKSSSDNIEEPYKFETPNAFYSDTEFTNKPNRRPSRPKPDQNEENYFIPPGLIKKKWRDEKTTEHDYYHELVTKKPTRGPGRKGSNKHTINNESSNSHRWEDINTTRRPEWSDQGSKGTAGNWYGAKPDYENGYQGTSPKRNNWGQETFSSTKSPDYFNGGEGNNYAGNTRRPQIYPPSSNFNPDRPDFQGSLNQGNKHPNYQQGSNFQNNRPNSRPGPQKRRRISEQKCEEYSKQITENITGLPLTTNPDPVTIPVRKCITPQQLIVGGENTTLGEFPHMAAIGFRDRNKKQIAWNCGGSLISELFVMTAAHCTSTSSGSPVKVRLGEYNLMKNDDGAYPVDYAIVEIITHPEYKPPSKYNDIALLKLSRKVTFFKHIRPACLYSDDTFSGSKAIATGWGRMYYDGGTSEILQKVVLSIVDNYTCNRLYKVNVKTEVLSRGIVDSQLCAGELTGGKDTCQGDSGGPLSITNTKCIHHIIGITSFGKSCALPNSTGVYTRVSAYVPWIESVVWPTS